MEITHEIIDFLLFLKDKKNTELMVFDDQYEGSRRHITAKDLEEFKADYEKTYSCLGIPLTELTQK